jgi:hypothetical protein
MAEILIQMYEIHPTLTKATKAYVKFHGKTGKDYGVCRGGRSWYDFGVYLNAAGLIKFHYSPADSEAKAWFICEDGRRITGFYLAEEEEEGKKAWEDQFGKKAGKENAEG